MASCEWRVSLKEEPYVFHTARAGALLRAKLVLTQRSPFGELDLAPTTSTPASAAPSQPSQLHPELRGHFSISSALAFIANVLNWPLFVIHATRIPARYSSILLAFSHFQPAWQWLAHSPWARPLSRPTATSSSSTQSREATGASTAR